MSNVSPGSEDQQTEGRKAVAVVVEALGVLQTRHGFVLPAELVEERARNTITALSASHTIVRIGPTGLGQALAHWDAASSIIVELERPAVAMASVFFRGPKSAPRWFARFRTEAGVWRSLRVRVETRKDAAAIARQLEAQSERRRYGLEAPESAGLLVGELMKRWETSLVNRSAYDDRSRLRLHVLPRFGSMRLVDLTLKVLMQWLDELRAARKLEPGTQRHLLNIVSRFFGWCIEREYTTVNPVRQIPAGRRPQHAPKRDTPWISDDDQVRAILRELPSPFSEMFYIGVTAGLRLGEIAGLRMSDVADLAAGAIRVRYSYNGWLKEDKTGGKVKWSAAANDAVAVIGPWIERRRAEGAPGEAFLFEQAFGRCYRKDAISYQWEKVADRLGLSLTWYQATRHSFASRNLSRGVPLDEVAAALGHSTPAVTQRHYNHFVRKTFSPLMTSGLGFGGGEPAPVIPIGARAAAGAVVVRPAGTEGDEHAA